MRSTHNGPRKVETPQSLYELQKFMARLIDAAAVILLLPKMIDPEHSDKAVGPAAAIVAEWLGLQESGRRMQMGKFDEGGEMPAERTTRHTPAAAPAPAHATRGTSAPLPRYVLAKLLLAMYAKRHFTGATSAVAGHLDGFGREVEDDLENKMTIDLDARFRWSGVLLDELPLTGLLPPGFLAYARTRAATVCVVGRDLEFHQLARAVHLGGNTQRWFALRTVVACAFATLALNANLSCRGLPATGLGERSTQALLERQTFAPAEKATLRCAWGSDGKCNLRGVALCDWWEARSAVQRVRFLRAHGRPVHLVNGIVQYFGPVVVVAAAGVAAGAGAAAGDDDDDDDE
tara:strand:+ start:159 stop:1199 length:1041 start_codon:yes stop_codon:yes gene_type:complete